MENTDKKELGNNECKNCPQNGCCFGMGMHHMMGHQCHGGRRHLVRVILKLVLAIIIFWCGFQLGQMTGFVKAEYGRGRMMENQNGFNMMRGNAWNYSNNLMPLNTNTNVNNGNQNPIPAK